MKKSRERKLLIVGGLALVIGFLVWTGLAVFVPKLRIREAARLLQSFEQLRDEAAAKRLIDLLDTQLVDSQTGNRILALLLKPDTHVKLVYPCGEPIVVECTYPYRFNFYNVDVLYTKQSSPSDPIGVGLKPRNGRAYPGDFLCVFTQGMREDGRQSIMNTPGLYAVNIRIECTLMSRPYRKVWKWPSSMPWPLKWMPDRESVQVGEAKPIYSCELEIPLKLNVAAPH